MSMTPPDIAALREVLGKATGRVEHDDQGMLARHKLIKAMPSLLDEVESLTAERDEIQSDWKAADAEVGRLKAELAAAREAFKAIADEAKRENGSWVHLKRCIAVQAIKALKTSDVDEVGR